jgi:hypothetical protein
LRSKGQQKEKKTQKRTNKEENKMGWAASKKRKERSQTC